MKKAMKKVLSLALGLALSLTLSSAAFAKEYRVAYIARAQADSFAAWLANGVKEEAKKYPDITVDVFDGQANDETENSLIENAITNKYDCIIIQPNNGEAQRPYAEKVVAAGIICITTNARIDGIEGDVLYQRYIKLHKWEEVCVLLHYSWQGIHLIHRRALAIVESRLKCT